MWLADVGVTCRRWHWRQGTRTRLTETSSDALFLLERLAPLSLAALDDAAYDLVAKIRTRAPHATVTRAVIGPATP